MPVNDDSAVNKETWNKVIIMDPPTLNWDSQTSNNMTGTVDNDDTMMVVKQSNQEDSFASRYSQAVRNDNRKQLEMQSY